MRRKLFTAGAAISLLLFVATVGVWMRSYWRTDSLVATRDLRIFSFDSQRGTLTFFSARAFPPYRLSDQRRWTLQLVHELTVVDYRPREPLTIPNRLGFAIQAVTWHLETEPMFVAQNVTVPDWTVCMALAALPTMLAIKNFRHKRKRGCCRVCSYNLTGNTSGVCAECGTPVQQKAEATA
ncbi:MAG TPA: hypothetical protein VK797_09025 [Tepidisphaeraceae bacterium]|jgi:hypothetical protein|nr:hypothetical protein [Tepidisphaeraceae bacterium]